MVDVRDDREVADVGLIHVVVSGAARRGPEPLMVRIHRPRYKGGEPVLNPSSGCERVFTVDEQSVPDDHPHMRWRALSLWLICVSLLWCSSARAASGSVEDIPVDSWIYDAVFELSSRGHFPQSLLHTRPLTRAEVADALSTGEPEDAGAGIWWERLRREFQRELSATDSAHYASGDRLHLGAGPTARLSYREKFPEKGRAGFDVVGAVQGGHKVGVRWRVRFDTDGRRDSQFHGEHWKEHFTAAVDQAVAVARVGRLHAAFGREYWRWGRSPHDAMLVSDHSPAFDGLRLTWRARRWSFAFHATALDPMLVFSTGYPDGQGPAGLANRYLVAHRLDWRPRHNLELAVSEVMVFGGINRPWELNYLNPFLPYYWEQLNNDVNDNPLWNLEVSWRPRGGLEVYGEWMIDDFQIDFHSEPHQIGVLGGLAWTPPGLSGRLFLNAEYQRINTFTYGQGRPWNWYFHHRDFRGEVIGIGSDLGTDADRLTVRPRWHLSKAIDLTGRVEYVRRGEDRLDRPQFSGVPKNVPFPSGTVERDFQSAVGAHLQWGGSLLIDLECGYHTVENAGHRLDAERSGGFVSLRLTGLWWRTVLL
jgi:hypothetical protein